LLEFTDGFSYFVSQKEKPSCCCLVTGYFTCLNIAACDVYLAEGCQSCELLLALIRRWIVIFTRWSNEPISERLQVRGLHQKRKSEVLLKR
jgi:hypothetical protein